MSRLRLPVALSGLAVLAACQAPPAPPVTPTSPSAAPTAGAPSGAPSAAPSGQASEQPAAQVNVLVTGHIFDDKGAALDGAKIEVFSTEKPQINQTIDAFGGAYAVSNVPAGTLVRLRASKDGYTTREQWLKAEAVAYGAEKNPNIRDFGGDGDGMLHALSQFPEIAVTEPLNKATDAPASPLKVVFRLSHPLQQDDRDRFARLLRVTVPGPNGDSVLRVGSSYRDQKATLSWDETGRVGTFLFDAPLVTYAASADVVTVGFDQTAPLENWPEDRSGRLLGQGQAANTYEGNGGGVRQQVAPFLRTEFPTTLPSTRPSPLELWGMVHSTNVSFNLKTDGARPKVVSVRGVKGTAGAVDRIFVTFDKPMRGFPETAAGVVNYHPSVLVGSNYRYFLGNTEKRDERERFESGDPATQGTPPDTPQFGANSDTIVVLPLSGGTLSNSTVLKVYVNEAVKDIAGNAVQTSTPDPVTHLADHVVQGVVQ